jgi:hypothetical protein
MTRTVKEALERISAKLDEWQVRALYLGAQTSASVVG